jgi:hypothetical protein
MAVLISEEISAFTEQGIEKFYQRCVESLSSLSLQEILADVNPYLWAGRQPYSAGDLVQTLLSHSVSSQEALFFEQFLKELAIFVCSRVFGGRKSAAEGIDLEFERDGVLYLVSIKSGPNWGNSSQVKRMVENFKKAQRILRTSGNQKPIVAVNGCCYGKDNQPDKGDYRKLCGQAFWTFISGNDQLYIEIIEPLGHQARQHNEAFQAEYARFSISSPRNFCKNSAPTARLTGPNWFNSIRPKTD